LKGGEEGKRVKVITWYQKAGDGGKEGLVLCFVDVERTKRGSKGKVGHRFGGISVCSRGGKGGGLKTRGGPKKKRGGGEKG